MSSIFNFKLPSFRSDSTESSTVAEPKSDTRESKVAELAKKQELFDQTSKSKDSLLENLSKLSENKTLN